MFNEDRHCKTAQPTINVPSSALNISKENTYPNASQDTPYLQPSEFTKELIETSNVKLKTLI